MFDKIPSLKDFIIYLMPGILISYFSLNIFNHIFNNSFTTEQISGNSVLNLVGIIFSFLIGFLFSQIQLIIYNKVLEKNFCIIRTIDGSQTSDQIKEILITRIIKVFEIPNANRMDILNDDLIIFTCLNYVKIKTNEESQQFINRSSNLSSFASALFLPINLGIINLLFILGASTCIIIWVITISSIIVFLITIKITLNFRDDWFKAIFRQFLILSKE